MAQISLKAQERKVLGRKVKILRREGILPANLYGKKIKSQPIQVLVADFKKVFDEAGETNIINLKIGSQGKGKSVLVSNLQEDPLSGSPVHIDFHQVDLKEKVTVDIPVEIKGESPAVKEKGAILITLLDEIKVEALPNDLPDEFKLDISNLNDFGDSILIKDLPVDKKKVSVLFAEEEAIVMVQEPKKEEPAPAEAEKEEAEVEEKEEPKKKTEKSPETTDDKSADKTKKDQSEKEKSS